MEKNWVKIFSSDKIYSVRLIQAMLEQEEIEAVEMNKQDSSYSVLGVVELYVQASHVVRAKYLIEKNNLE
jgi:hypothetical protein